MTDPPTAVVAAIQLNSNTDKRANLARATQWIIRAAEAGAELVALPELFNCLGPVERIVAGAETIGGPSSEALAQLAADLKIYLVAGICEAFAKGKGYNTTLAWDPDGELVARYRKIHLFDAQLPHGGEIRESSHILPGHEVVTWPAPWGRVGQATCYDLRFPELFRDLARRKVNTLIVPSAFTAATGRDHWEILVRARAIENQAFLVAPNQVGRHSPHLTSYGHSMIVDPWGNILAEAVAEEETFCLATLDLSFLETVRRTMPCLAHRHLGLGDKKR